MWVENCVPDEIRMILVGIHGYEVELRWLDNDEVKASCPKLKVQAFGSTDCEALDNLRQKIREAT